MKSFYESLGIYELRGIAREMGIKSPTSKHKNVLIDEILNFDKTKIEKKSKQGRPPLVKKVNLKTFDCNDLVKRNVYLALKQNNETNKTLKKLLKLFK